MMRHSLYRSIAVMYIMQPCWWFMRLHVNVRVCANFSAKFRFILAFHGFHLTWIVASIGSLSTLSERRTIAAYMADAFAYYRNAMFRWQIDGSTTAPRSCYDVHTDIGYGQYNILLCFAANIAKFRAKKTKKNCFISSLLIIALLLLCFYYFIQMFCALFTHTLPVVWRYASYLFILYICSESMKNRSRRDKQISRRRMRFSCVEKYFLQL